MRNQTHDEASHPLCLRNKEYKMGGRGMSMRISLTINEI